MLIDTPARREAMASPLRLELLEHLGALGQATVKELAARMGKSPQALHYHVRLLTGTGILRIIDTRKSGPRDQAVYDLAAERYEVMLKDATDPADFAPARVVRAVLRSAERDYESMAAADPARLEADDVFAGRMRSRLSVAGRKKVMKHINAIQRIFADEFRRDHPPQAKVETYTLTCAFLPEAPRE